MRWLPILAVLATLLWPAAGRADGKLDRARDEIRGGDDGDGDRDHDEERSERNRHQGDDDDHDYDEGESDGLANALLRAFFDAWTSDASQQGPRYGYARYPYAPGAPGYLVSRTPQLAFGSGSARSDAGFAPTLARPHVWAAQLSLDGGYLDGIARTGPSVRLLTPARLELDARVDVLLEPDAPGGTDHASVGQSHVSYRIGEAERMMLRFGLGVRWFTDAEGTDVGPDVVIGTDAFVVRPLVLSLNVGLGVLGQAVVPSARVQLGVMLDRVELFAGYDHLQIGEVFLGTPMLGTRIWL